MVHIFTFNKWNMEYDKINDIQIIIKALKKWMQ